MRNISTLLARAPKVSGKVCAQHVARLWDGCAQKVVVTHSPFSPLSELWKTSRFIRALYTNCMQVFTATVGKFTSVISDFYTVYTGPIKTTTTYINKYLGEHV